MSEKAIITCALTGVLTDPNMFPVPVTPEQMANEALDAYNAGASLVHVHFRDQSPGKGALPSWDPNIAAEICDAIKSKAPDLLINMSTGVLGNDISGPISCLERVRPETAALNAGSLNYLKTKRDGTWAWNPILFDNPLSKIQKFIDQMKELNIVPECECFDTGIVRSVKMFKDVGLLPEHYTVSFVMGVASGMPNKSSWLPLLVDELPEGAHWQTIAIGRQEVWELHRRCAELGGHLRTGLEDTFYLPNGDKTGSNGALIEALANVAKSAGREVATPNEARKMLGITK